MYIIWLRKYLLVKHLGHGGNGQVYLATHLSLHSCCAIKRVSKKQDSYPQALKEARLLRLLNHSGIPRIFDFEEDDQYGYLIEEYVQGETLQDYCKEHNVHHREIADIMLQVCQILSYLHQQNPPVFYLDLKPSNVIYHDRKVTLIDFGNAVCEEEALGHLASYGTVGFAAPEQYGMLSVGPQSDIYAAGVLLKYLLGEQENKQAVKRRKRMFLAEEKALWNVADRCMQFHPMKRYATIKEVEYQLQKMRKKEKGQKIQEQMLTIALASCGSRMGTTHAALWLCAYQNRKGVTAYYVDCSQNQNAEKWIASAGVQKMDGSFQYKQVRVIPRYLYEKGEKKGAYILDCGSYQKMQDEHYYESRVRCLVAGTSPWEQTELQDAVFGGDFDQFPIVLFSFSNEGSVRMVQKKLGIRKGVRIPYHSGIDEICEGEVENEEPWMEKLFEYACAGN